jgi:hypothetical protein
LQKGDQENREAFAGTVSGRTTRKDCGMNEPKSFDRVKKNWEEQIKKIVDKVENAKSLTNQEIIHDLSRLKPGFCKEIRIERCQMIGNTGLSVFFDKPFAPFGIRLETLTPLSVSVLNLFAKEPVATNTGKNYPLWKEHENVLAKIDENVLFNPPKEAVLKVFFQFFAKNRLDRHAELVVNDTRYKHFSVLTGDPMIGHGEMLFFPKKITIKELTNIILATGNLPKTKVEASSFYKNLKLAEAENTFLERT